MGGMKEKAINLLEEYGDLVDIFAEDFENEDNTWSVESTASAGQWILGVPNGTSENGVFVQTYEDHSENGENCFITGNELVEESSPGQADVDGGYTILYSDVYNLSNYTFF